MTTFTVIANSEIDADSPVTTTLMQAYRDNIAATAEGSTNAPVLSSAWHPADMVLEGDGNDGEEWSFATDGAVANLVINLAAGYEYMIFFNDVETTGVGNWTIEFYRVTDAAYTTARNITQGTTAQPSGPQASQTYQGLLYLPFVTLPGRYNWKWEWVIDMQDSTSAAETYSLDGPGDTWDATGQAVDKVRIDPPGNFDAGSIHLWRRKYAV